MSKIRKTGIVLLGLLAPVAASAESMSQITLEKLLADGWEVAGFAAALTAFGSVILFKHKDRHYFVQCSAIYDATRGAQVGQRVITNCYELH